MDFATAAALGIQQLAEFLAVVSKTTDPVAAARIAAERACRALDAEVGAVLSGDVVTAVGFPVGRVPEAELADVATGGRSTLRLSGVGECPAIAAPIGGTSPGHLVVARYGAKGFSVDEVSLVRGMARVLELTVDRIRMLAAERQQAAENERLLVSVRERQRLLEQLSGIQRAIARRDPLQAILDQVTAGAQALLGGNLVALCLRDSDDPDMLLMVSQSGLREELARALWRRPIHGSGAAGQAVLRNELAVAGGVADCPITIPELVEERLHSAVAVPVHEGGVVAGSLVVGSFAPGHEFDSGDREVLQAFAEHVSLAVTDAKTLEAMHQAFHDSLTGLASRRLFMDRLQHGLAVAGRERARTAVIFLDLDRFKHVNDSLGHAAGDALLVEVAARLRACLRSGDTAARFGGDEFAVLLCDAPPAAQVTEVAQRILADMRAPFLIAGKEIFVGASVGIALGTGDGEDADALMSNADLAMYEAKKNGKDRYELFEPSMQATFQRTVEMESDLRRALDRDEFVVHYQPIVDLASGRVTGHEALVRWQHAVRGLVAPMEFVPLAENTGLIVPIGTWVLREACRHTARWNARRADRGEPALSISVNLSARQIQQPELPSVVADALADSGLDAGCLVLEMTESMLVSDIEAAMRRLHQLKALGVRLAIDDFGTGYSSLAYLHRFPVDVIKIDKSFVDGFHGETADATLARAIVNLGQTLDLVTVAEGIEGARQRDELQHAGCQLGQGYYFAKPLDGRQVQALLFDAAPGAGASRGPELPAAA